MSSSEENPENKQTEKQQKQNPLTFYLGEHLGAIFLADWTSWLCSSLLAILEQTMVEAGVRIPGVSGADSAWKEVTGKLL